MTLDKLILQEAALACLRAPSTQRKVPRGREDAERLTADVIELARQYGRYGYRKIAALLRDAGWLVSDTRVERVWQREGLKVPQKQPKRGRLWLTNGSCIRLRPEHSNHVWSYDFVEDRTHDGGIGILRRGLLLGSGRETNGGDCSSARDFLVALL